MTFPVLSAGTSAYNLTNSLRFRSSASAYLNRTPASAGNRTTWTWSAWVKRGAIGSATMGIWGVDGSTNYMFMILNNSGTNNELDCGEIATTQQWRKQTTQVFRDASSWYHLVLAFDSTQATASNRVKIYVNGSQVTAFSASADPSLNYNSIVNTTTAHSIGRVALPTGFYFDGYLTEVNFIDGQALTPSSFGSTNATTGVWQPAKYTGTYGTNGFYLPFTNTTSTTTLGNDFSGNGNNWTTNNISLTSGVTYDSMTDVPTLTSPTTANYAVLNPLALSGGWSTANANLSASATQATNQLGTIGVSSGKWYFEYSLTADIDAYIGVSISTGGAITAYRKDGTRYNGSSFVSYGATYTTGDVIGCAFDVTSGTVEYFKNGASQGSVSGISYASINVPIFFIGAAGGGYNANFGQRPFAYTPPSGFVALNTFNLPSSTIPAGNKFMDATTYTGTGSSLSVTNSGSMQPDWVWIKSRSAATDHALYDVLRGTQARLESNTTDAEVTSDSGVTAFGTGGFTVGTLAQVNTNAATYVGWQWKANGAGVTNTAGSITSTVSANTTSGFSVVGFPGPTSGSSATVGHGLGVAPSMVIVKYRNAATNWSVYHASIGNTDVIFLNTTAAKSTNSTYWNNTSPSSSVFTLGSAWIGAGSFDLIAYCFAQIAGFSAFGSYTGNGSSDGPFIYTGFRPRWVMMKSSSAVGNWIVFDSSRLGYNGANDYLLPNSSSGEGTDVDIDILSNGFKPRDSAGPTNVSGTTYIYAAFAENPFKNALAR